MKLLTRPTPARAGRLPNSDTVFTAGVIAGLVGLEYSGRFAVTDIHDAVAAVGLLAIVTAVVIWHRRRPLGWVSRGLGWCRAVRVRLGQWKYEHGIDLRGSP
ncbi:MAG: hypothetical protein ACRC7O_07585, partial [Fimbriiglobus sp.]